MTIFKLPDLGEGLQEAEIVEWHVQEGQIVKVDEPLVTVETAKAMVEVPSPFTGKIQQLYGQRGDVIKTHAPLVMYALDENTSSSNKANAEDDLGTVAGKLEVGNTVITETATALTSNMARRAGIASTAGTSSNVKATPAIRALAQRLNVDLATITPSGPNQTITSQDVENAAKFLQTAGELEPLKGTRRVMAQVMSQSHAEVVPVTVMEDAKLLHWNKEQDVTVRLIQALAFAIIKEPALNAWFDARNMGRRLIQGLQLGLAIDTPEGLFVPVIRNAEKLQASLLREQIDLYKKQVLERTVTTENMRGASITLSNFGKYAGRYSNPIVVPPTVAILGVGKLRDDVIAHEGTPRVCPILPLSLTFDHRAVTGGEATRFLDAVIESLSLGVKS